MRIIAVIPLLLMIAGALHAATALTSCALINAPGEYVLTNSVNGSPYSNTCIRITASDVDFDCAGYAIENGSYGVYIDKFNHNVTIRNCTISNYTFCMDIDNGVRNSTVSGNNFTDCNPIMASGGSTNESYYIRNLSITGNRFISTGSHAISCYNMNDSLIAGNYFFNLSDYLSTAVYFQSRCQNNTISGNELTGIGSGIAVGSESSKNNIIENNHFHDFFGSYGIDVYSSNNIIRNNNLSNCTYSSSYGILLYTWVSNNSVYNNSVYRFNNGIYANVRKVTSPAPANYTNNTIFNNTVWNMTSTGSGIYLTGEGSFTQVYNNTVFNAYRCVQLNQGDGHVVANNTLFNCTVNGIDINGSTTNATISGNEIYDSTYALYFSGTQYGHTIDANEVHGNQKGIYVNVANAHNITNTHLYNNRQDIEIYGGSIGGYYYNVSLANTIIDNPMGNYQNFTNLTLQDRANASVYIYVNWTNGTAAPSGNLSFANKWANISKSGSGNASIDSLVWHWRADEVGSGDNEGSFALYSYNSSGWTLQNGTPDTTGHTLSLYNHVPASFYGILQTEREYLWLNSPGTYTLTSDMLGPGGAVSGVAGISTAVIIIDSDDVVFDCGGYSITNDATPDAAAILVNGSAGQEFTNITIRNCPSISGYEYGAYINYGNSVDAFGLNISGNDNGVRVEDSSQVFLGDSNVSASTNNGVDIGGGCSDVTVNNTQVFDNGGDGVSDTGATGTSVNGCQIFGNGDDGVDTTGTSGATIDASDIWGNGDDGVSDTGGSGTSVDNSNIFNNTDDGISTNTTTSTSMDANDIFGNGGDGWQDEGSTAPSCGGSDMHDNDESGAELVGTGGATMDANDIFGNGGDGATLDGTTGVEFDGNNVTGNGGDGVHVDNSDGVVLSNTQSESNGGSGASVSESSGTVVDPSWFCNNAIGVLINASNDTVLDDAVACNNTQHGIYVLESDGTLINRSRTYNNARDLSVDNPGASAISLTVRSLVFDRPSGDLQDYSDISLEDSVAASSGYFLNWTANASALPANYSSFNDKFVTIEAVSGTVSIDAINWTWANDEAVGYDESLLSIWEDSGSWSDMGAALDAASNILSLSGLSPASDYGILYNGTPPNATTIYLYAANITNVTDLPRWGGEAAGNASTEGGNISAMNISGQMLTDRWAGYYGNISAELLLADSAGAMVYSWSWSPSDGGTVCLSTNSSATEVDALPASAGDIDAAWGFGSTSDSAAYTFTSTNCTLAFGTELVSNAAYADTGLAGGFVTCAMKNSESPSKDGLFFCTAIEDAGALWNGQSGNFELMVPTDDAPGATETYYFYVNLN